MQNKKLLVLAVGAALVIPGAALRAEGRRRGGEDRSRFGRRALRQGLSRDDLAEHGKGATDAGTAASRRFRARAAPRHEQHHHAQRDGVEQLALRRARPREARRRPEGDLPARDRSSSSTSNNTGLRAARLVRRPRRTTLGHDQAGPHGHAVQDLRRRPLVPRRLERQLHLDQQRAAQDRLRHAARPRASTCAARTWCSTSRRTSAGFDGAVAVLHRRDGHVATRKPHVWSGGGKWECGPFESSLAHEIHWDLFGGSRNVPTAMSQLQRPERALEGQGDAGACSSTRSARTPSRPTTSRRSTTRTRPSPGASRATRTTPTRSLWDARWNAQWRTALEYIKADEGHVLARERATATPTAWTARRFSSASRTTSRKRTYLFAMGALLKNGFSASYNNSASQAPSVGRGHRAVRRSACTPLVLKQALRRPQGAGE